MEIINDSLKHVAKSAELIKAYIEMSNMEDQTLLLTALEFLELVIDMLSKSANS